MATNLMQTSKKLIQALNSRGYKLTFSQKQFIGNFWPAEKYEAKAVGSCRRGGLYACHFIHQLF